MKIIRPRKELRPYVRYYWALETDQPFSVLTFPIGCPQMIFHRKSPLYIPETGTSQSRFTVSGQVNFPAHISSVGDTEMIVAVFYPHTISMFIHTPPSAFYNQEISGYDIENRSFSELADRVFECSDTPTAISLIEQWLASGIKHTLNIDRIGASLSAMLRSASASVETLASTACLGKKQFERLFRQYVGMNPKEYGRIVRFQRALRMMQLGSSDYADIAYATGYSDQSHLIREFRQFSGLTPRQLVEYQTPYSDLYTVPV
ncbi:MAG: helix-turn-helix transcriptional regulator [Muribaculaceae bacterium]|nr:helix-turn-helix transcriptional regulator [Muribaculaceae bacterium]